MRQFFAFVCLSLALVGCSQTAKGRKVVRLSEIIANPGAWNGKVVTIEGWLWRCSGIDCHILTSREDLDVLERGARNESIEDMDGVFRDHAVSVGFDEQFDRQAKPLQGKHVLLTAKVNADHWRSGCLDRCDQLTPVSVQNYHN